MSSPRQTELNKLELSFLPAASPEPLFVTIDNAFLKCISLVAFIKELEATKVHDEYAFY